MSTSEAVTIVAVFAAFWAIAFVLGRARGIQKGRELVNAERLQQSGTSWLAGKVKISIPRESLQWMSFFDNGEVEITVTRGESISVLRDSCKRSAVPLSSVVAAQLTAARDAETTTVD